MTSKKNIIITIMAFALGLLSAAAGVPKILQMPQELGFLAAIGLSATTVSILGAVQLASGVMLFWSRPRFVGVLLASLALLVSSVAIFSSGNAVFGFISLLPLVISTIVIYAELQKRKPNTN